MHRFRNFPSLCETILVHKDLYIEQASDEYTQEGDDLTPNVCALLLIVTSTSFRQLMCASTCLYQQNSEDLKNDGTTVQLAKVKGTDEHCMLTEIVTMMRTETY